MRTVLTIVAVTFLVFVATAIITATPLVGEVVTLHTKAQDGSWESTRLWIVESEQASYLRAGSPESGWVARLRANPEARLERSGSVQEVRLVEDSAMRDSVHEMMADKYGWANDFVGLMGGDRALSLAFRLETAPGAPE